MQNETLRNEHTRFDKLEQTVKKSRFTAWAQFASSPRVVSSSVWCRTSHSAISFSVQGTTSVPRRARNLTSWRSTRHLFVSIRRHYRPHFRVPSKMAFATPSETPLIGSTAVTFDSSSDQIRNVNVSSQASNSSQKKIQDRREPQTKPRTGQRTRSSHGVEHQGTLARRA